MLSSCWIFKNPQISEYGFIFLCFERFSETKQYNVVCEVLIILSHKHVDDSLQSNPHRAQVSFTKSSREVIQTNI